MQTDLVKIAHQLIETANALIKAAYDPKTIAQTTEPLPFHGVTEQISREVKSEFFEEDKPSKRSQFSNRTEKIQHIRSQIQECESVIAYSKNPKEVDEAKRKLSAFRGHLTKVMNQPSAGGGSTWKSRV
jgi:hypothetical protein